MSFNMKGENEKLFNQRTDGRTDRRRGRDGTDSRRWQRLKIKKAGKKGTFKEGGFFGGKKRTKDE